ncbi:MAG: RDD family protein [Bacteroidota bacterium]|nr:RDD family protein [Bacteroidota bacterium]
MSTIRIATSFNIDLEFTAASFHRRLIAWILDVFVLLFYIYVVFKMIDFFESNHDAERTWALVILLIIPLFTYHLFCELLMNGQSVGKRIMGLRVVNENGGRPAISQFIIRWLIRTSDYMVVVILLYGPIAATQNMGFFWKISAAFSLFMADVILMNATKKHQRLGDILAHTLLIRTEQKADINDTIFCRVQDNYKPSFPQVMGLSDRDVNALKSILDTAKKHNDYQLANRAAEKIQLHLKIETDMLPFDFLEVLLKDYNYLSGS